MRRPIFMLSFLLFSMLFIVNPLFAATPDVASIEVEGNNNVVSQHILGVVESRIGEPLNQEQIQKDIEAIYGLGFFSYVDARIEPAGQAVSVIFVVTENPVVEKVDFIGNTVYSDETLMKLVFTSPGSVFNRVFFRHDLQRIKEKFQDDGYVMMRIKDVQVDDGIVKVYILEPRIGEIVIQGNKKTKTYVVRRVIKMEEGDLFNSIILRHSLNKLRALGYFEDVSVGFEPAEEDDKVDIILTVKEQKTGNISFSISKGSSSGWGGGVGYSDSNMNGRGIRLDTGFELGDYEKYWASLSDSYMDEKVYAWKIGVYSREFEDREYWDKSIVDAELFEYDEKKKGFYIGAGRKFKGDNKLSWFATLDWHDSDVSFKSGSKDMFDLVTENGGTGGTNFSLTGQVTRNNLDPYLSYKKGDLEKIAVEQSFEFLGGDWSFTKYWFEGMFFAPIKGIDDFFDIEMKKDNPFLFASRIMVGSSAGDIPWMERYELGGSTTLRGYDSGQFKGEEILLGNFEFRVPIEDVFSVVLFYDIGNTEMDFSEMKDDYGFGVRVKTPMGNLRLDYATGEDDHQFHFGFGEIF